MPTKVRLQLQRICIEAEGYLELGMPEHAIRALQRRGQLVHGDARGCYLLGEALRETRRFNEAVYPLRRSLELIPDDTHVCLALGWCYKRTGRLEDAIDVLEHAVHLDPGEAILHYNLACYCSLARHRRQALQHLAYALEIDGNFRDLVADEADFDPIRHDPLFQSLTGTIG
ncbi:MAG TPA: tetratricopeptide repeat protein [Lacipirellulaceae bacterium]|nr:tetratricopeptide repeat protein [Lacipirellulaceae bacterium]